jgi:hypothetical protein
MFASNAPRRRPWQRKSRCVDGIDSVGDGDRSAEVILGLTPAVCTTDVTVPSFRRLRPSLYVAAPGDSMHGYIDCAHGPKSPRSTLSVWGSGRRRWRFDVVVQQPIHRHRRVGRRHRERTGIRRRTTTPLRRWICRSVRRRIGLKPTTCAAEPSQCRRCPALIQLATAVSSLAPCRLPPNPHYAAEELLWGETARPLSSSCRPGVAG